MSNLINQHTKIYLLLTLSISKTTRNPLKIAREGYATETRTTWFSRGQKAGTCGGPRFSIRRGASRGLQAKTSLIRKTNRSWSTTSGPVPRAREQPYATKGPIRRRGPLRTTSGDYRKWLYLYRRPLLGTPLSRGRVRLSEGNFAGIGGFFCRTRLFAPAPTSTGLKLLPTRGVQVFRERALREHAAPCATLGMCRCCLLCYLAGCVSLEKYLVMEIGSSARSYGVAVGWTFGGF